MTRPAVSVENLSVAVGDFSLRDVGLALEAGEIGVILGPNGAGKSVTLEAVAGFHPPLAGRIRIGGRDVTGLPPEHRRVGFIFQNFGLFPHLTVAQNVAFGLRARPRDGAKAGGVVPADLVARLMTRFDLEALARRSPVDLSPGEKQRVALARSLATQPDLFLLDEPFSALDARTSQTLREELKCFLREAGIPAIFVTHDHVDALVLADWLAVMHAGRILQSGSPAEVFARPAGRFIAEFLGVENLVDGRLLGRDAAYAYVEIAGRTLRAHAADAADLTVPEVCVCIRAENVSIAGALPGAAVPADGLSGRIVSIAGLGPLARVTLDCGFPLVACVLARSLRELGLERGTGVVAAIDPAAVRLIAFHPERA